MKKIYSIVLAIMIAFSLVFSINIVDTHAADKTIKILFIGNSITYRDTKNGENNFIEYFSGLAKSSGKKVKCYRLTKGGSNLSRWYKKDSYKKKLIKLCKENDFDYVVLQENTDYAIKYPDTMQNSIKGVLKLIRKYDKDFKIIYNASWNYKYGKFGRTYKTGQKIINSNYVKARKLNGGKISYSGQAFKVCRDNYNIDLWLSDNNHPTKYGSYLSACCMYNTIFNKHTYGNKYTAGLNSKTVKKLQKVADSIY